MNVTLRNAVSSDAYALWLWANDPAVRIASGDRGLIQWGEHLDWIAGRLASRDVMMLIGVIALERPIGTIRFETEDRWATARVSYLVAPEARGDGLGRQLLERGMEALVEVHPAARADALVTPANGASCHLFRSLGWTEEHSAAGLVRFLDPGRRGQ